MSSWVTCPACNLKHSARPDGTCPRCKTSFATASVAEGVAAGEPAPVMVEPRPEPSSPPIPPPIVPGASGPAWPSVPASGVPLRSTADLVYGHEPPLFALSLAISVLFWLLLLVGTFGMALLYAPFVFLMYLFTQSALIAYLKGTAIRITPRQFPDLHARVAACSERLGLAQAPDCYLLNGQGGFNAFATRFLGRNFVILFSDVVDALEDRPGAVDFYVGHELAHVKRGHLVWRPALLPASLLPLLGAAYHRACESTCDRHGAACCADTHDAVAALTALAAGHRRWKSVSTDEYVAQADESGGFWMSFNELVSDYPWLVKRVARVVAFRDGTEPRLPARNPLAYLLGLFVPRTGGGGAGGGIVSLLVVVAIVGIIAAIAIPSLLRARISANEAATIGDLRSVLAAEGAYAREHGRFTSVECLAGQPRCRVPASPPSLTAPLAASEVRHGYRFELELDPRSGSAFAYTAVPISPGQTGIRSFCGDGSGMIYASRGEASLTAVERTAERTSCNPELTPLGRP
jgi:Zn-dependent protease with chaperone function/type II secretory pathway pseudopilin PulG